MSFGRQLRTGDVCLLGPWRLACSLSHSPTHHHHHSRGAQEEKEHPKLFTDSGGDEGHRNFCVDLKIPIVPVWFWQWWSVETWWLVM